MSLNITVAVLLGIVILGLGVLGGLVSLRPPKSDSETQIYVVLFVFLGFVGVLLIAWQSYRADHSQSELTAKVDKLVKLVRPPQQPSADVTALAKRVEQLESSKTQDLKTRASLLSAQLLRFLAYRQRSEPALPKAETWSKDTDALIRYFQETMTLYSQQFAARVIAMRNELAEHGFTDAELDRMYEHPTNPIGVRIVGERLGALAQRLQG